MVPVSRRTLPTPRPPRQAGSPARRTYTRGMPPRGWKRTVSSAAGAMLIVVSALAQGREFGGFGPRGPFHVYPNIHYDGRFTFVRVSYDTAPGGYWYGGWPAWGHGYPIAEQNLMNIMNEVSYLNPHVEEINTITFD